MSCEGYREELSDALLSGDGALSAALAQHLLRCTDCAEFYETQKRLVTAMDSGVQAMVNEKVPASLLPSVRTRMEEVEFARQWSRWLLPAAGVVALILFIFNTSVRWGSRTMSQQVVTRDVSFVLEKKDHLKTGEPVVLSMHPPPRRRRAAKAFSEPEAVPRGAILSAEQAAVARFASEHPEEMAAVVQAAVSVPPDLSKPIEIIPLKIENIELAPLTAETED